MAILLELWWLLPLLGATPAPAKASRNSCAYCHSKAKTHLSRSVHRSAELTCTSCHGGNPQAMKAAKAHDSTKGFIGKPRGAMIIKTCARCHSDVRKMRAYHLPADQFFEYKMGAHAKAVYGKKKPDGATCVDCHGSHEIRRVNDTSSPVYKTRIPKTCARCHSDAKLMKKYGLPADTHQRYARGVHGRLLLSKKSLKVPTCDDCHGSHGVTAFRAKQVAFICGHCHRVTRDYFMRSPHFKAFRSKKLGECTTCHGNHEVRKRSAAGFLSTEKGGCLSSGCHDGRRPGDRGAEVARRIGTAIQSFQARIARASKRLQANIRQGYPVGKAEEHLDEARRVLLRLGPITHTVSKQEVQQEINRGLGMVREAEEIMTVKGREVRDRRIGSVVVLAFLFLILLCMIVKYLRLRRRILVAP